MNLSTKGLGFYMSLSVGQRVDIDFTKAANREGLWHARIPGTIEVVSESGVTVKPDGMDSVTFRKPNRLIPAREETSALMIEWKLGSACQIEQDGIYYEAFVTDLDESKKTATVRLVGTYTDEVGTYTVPVADLRSPDARQPKRAPLDLREKLKKQKEKEKKKAKQDKKRPLE